MKWNPSRRLRIALLVILASASGAFAADPNAPALKVGFAERDITPLIGMERPGGYGKGFHTAFHDACKVRVAVFDDGRKTVALVGTDTLMIPRALVQAAREKIQQRCKIAPEAVLVGASHSHSSGPVGMVQPGEFDQAPPLVRELAYEKSSTADPAYLQQVEAAIVDGVYEAWRTRQPATCGFGSGTEDKVSFNRRHRMKGGVTYTHPHFGNPDMLDYAGPIDPEVGVIAAWNETGELLGVVVNFACHATTSPPGISANWIHYLEQTIRGALGTHVPVVFLQGASGDITQVDNASPYRNPTGDEWARQVGGRVGAEAVKTILLMTPGADVPVDFASRVKPIRRRAPSAQHLAESLAMVQQTPGEVGSVEWTFAKEIVLLDAMIAREPRVDVEVQAIQVGPAVFLTNPAELFCQLGLAIKEGSPFPFTYPVELANGCVGYVPTEEALGPGGGGYETRLTSYTNLEPTAGTQMVQIALELAKSLKPGAQPAREPAPAFTAPWGYGATKPQVE